VRDGGFCGVLSGPESFVSCTSIVEVRSSAMKSDILFLTIFF
jgi:hypothetical protein